VEAFFEVVPIGRIVPYVGMALSLGSVIVGLGSQTRRYADREAQMVRWARIAAALALSLIVLGLFLMPRP